MFGGCGKRGMMKRMSGSGGVIVVVVVIVQYWGEKVVFFWREGMVRDDDELSVRIIEPILGLGDMR